MLQRAASNAYSWWWASNIRTKQSKWLDNNLQEMEDKVKSMIQLIDADGDSFAKKAELYFRRRPELINFVEETYRSYKALADKYDRISTELHKANHTIATAFPDQVHLVMQDDDDDNFSKGITSIDTTKIRKPAVDLPPLASKTDNKSNQPAPRRQNNKKLSSEMNKEKAQVEIERLQKEILVLQTEKEFVKTSYQSGLAKFWSIEKQITEMQEEVTDLEDGFSVAAVIEDDDARALMAAAALKSCEDSMANLQKQQNITIEEARIESERIGEAREKLKALKGESGDVSGRVMEESIAPSMTKEEFSGVKERRLELEPMSPKVKEHFENNSEPLMIEMAEKIDGLVEKVIEFESTVSSQSAQIKRLRSETDELHNNLKSLEEEKKTLIDYSITLTERLNIAETELQRIQQVEKSLRDEKAIIQTQLTEASNRICNISEKLQSDEQLDQVMETHEVNEAKEERTTVIQNEVAEVANTVDLNPSENKLEMLLSDVKHESQLNNENTTNDVCSRSSELETEPEDLEDASELLKEQESRDTKLLIKYASIIRNYKETKNRLSEIEKRKEEHYLELMEEMEELKKSNAMKDEEIRILRERLDRLQANINLNANAPESDRKTEDQIEKDKSSIRTPLVDPVSLAVEENIRLQHIIVLPDSCSSIEEKFREEIDTVLEENLDFWLRFSTSYHQIQKFQLTFKEFQEDTKNLNATKTQECSTTCSVTQDDGIPKSNPDEKRLRELNTELQVWLEQNALLKGELQCRYSSLCSIQDEISKVAMSSESENVLFTPYHAAKYQGEVLSMQLENNKVAKELQTGLDHVKLLQVEVGRALEKNCENFELSTTKKPRQNSQQKYGQGNNKIPLKTFLFNSKPKKQSIFAYMNPHLHRHHNEMRRGFAP